MVELVRKPSFYEGFFLYIQTMSQQAIAIAITCTFLRNTFKDIRMKPNEKQEVIALFSEYRKQPKEKYKALAKVLLKSPNATPSQKRYVNASRYSDANLQSLEYDIKKLCGITNSDISRAVKLAKQNNIVKTISVLPIEITSALEKIDLSKADYHKHLKPLAKNISEATGKEADSIKKVDLIAFIESFIPVKEPSTSQQLADLDINIFKEAPEIVKQGIKFRDKYPFLSEEDCPDEFKILVSDMFTAYDNFRDGRKELKALIAAGASNEDIFEIARKTVADFELDLEIGDELEYYQEHGKILGEHPIFSDKMLAEKIETMSTVELTKRQKNLRTYVSRDTKALNKMDDGEAKIKFEEKLQTFKDELALVDARLEKIS